jgi:hypothetical protein
MNEERLKEIIVKAIEDKWNWVGNADLSAYIAAAIVREFCCVEHTFAGWNPEDGNYELDDCDLCGQTRPQGGGS